MSLSFNFGTESCVFWKLCKWWRRGGGGKLRRRCCVSSFSNWYFSDKRLSKRSKKYLNFHFSMLISKNGVKRSKNPSLDDSRPRITKYLKSVMFYNSKIFTKSACQRLTHLFTQPLPSTRCIWLLHQKIIESWTQIPWHLSSFSRSLLFWEALWEVWQQIGVTLEFASLLSHWSNLEVPTSILL